jgi:hypothetical protein
VLDRCCRNRTDRAVDTEYGGEGRAHSEPEDCDKMFNGGVLFVVCTAVVLYGIMQRKLLTGGGNERNRK